MGTHAGVLGSTSTGSSNHLGGVQCTSRYGLTTYPPRGRKVEITNEQFDTTFLTFFVANELTVENQSVDR